MTKEEVMNIGLPRNFAIEFLLDYIMISKISEHKQALFIEQEIEKYLNIKDKKVRGELE